MNSGMSDLIMTAEEFPTGLRCCECNVEITEGQPYSQRLEGVDVWPDDVPILQASAGEPLYWTSLVCVPCGMAVRH